MLSYPHGMMLDNNYGILKTETYIGFAPRDSHFQTINDTEHMKWVLAPVEASTQRNEVSARSLKTRPKPKRGRAKHHKCIFKIFKKGEDTKTTKRRRRRRTGHGHKLGKMGKKLLMPLILGLLAAKSVLIPVALKALAFMSAKGLMMGFFSTVMASVLSLKGMFDHRKEYDRKDEKTQVEVIQVPSKHDEHYYTEDGYPYKRVDFVQMQPLSDTA